MKGSRRLFTPAAALLFAVAMIPSVSAAQCAKCESNKCKWGPYLNGAADCQDWAPGLGCVPTGECGETLLNITPGGGVYNRMERQVVADNGTTYLRACSGALISVRMSEPAAVLQRETLSQIVF